MRLNSMVLMAGGIALGAVGILQTPAEATILTFDRGAASTWNSWTLDTSLVGTALPNYADRVASTTVTEGANVYTYSVGTEGWTPNVVAGWSNARTYRFSGGNDASYGRSNEGATTGIYVLTLTADAGYDVVLYGMDMGRSNAAGQLNSIIVTDQDNNELFKKATATTFANQNQHYPLDFNTATPAAGVTGHTITLTIDMTSSGNDTWIDNLRFGQVAIPEPASMSILGIGALGLLARRRRGA